MALIQNVQFTFAPEDAAEAEAMFRELCDASRSEAGVVSFDVGRSQANANVFALWEVYRDQGAFDFHKNTGHYQRLVTDGVRPLAKERSGEVLSPI
jgi:(4S)-4-hydroxy-5-phosphonooxypentane-2,3-dione isomerase